MKAGNETKGEPVLGTNWLKGGAAVLVVFGIWAGGNYLSGRYDDYQTSCGGLVDDLTEMSKNQQTVMSPLLIDVVEVKTISTSETSTDCRGLGIYSDGSKTPINFRHHEEHGKWWLTADPIM